MVEQIKEKINGLDANSFDLTSLENSNLISNINSLTNEEEQKEVVDYLIARVKEILETLELDRRDEIKVNFTSFLRKFLDEDKITEITNELEQLYPTNRIDAEYEIISDENISNSGEVEEEIVEQNDEINEEEISRINDRIAELENELVAFDTIEKIDVEIKKNEQEKSDIQAKLSTKNEEIKEKIIQFDGQSDAVINKLNDELKTLQDKKNLIYPQAHLFGRPEQVHQLEEVNSQIKTTKAEIEKIKMDRTKKIELNSRLGELKNSLINLKEEDFLEEAKRKVSNMNLREQNANFVNRITKSLYLQAKKNLEEDIKNTEIEIVKIENIGFIKHLEKKLSSLKEEDFLEEAKRQAASMNLRGPQTDEYIKKLTHSLYLRTKKSIEAEILEYKNGNNSVLKLEKNEISELEDRLSTVDSKLNKLNELKKLKEKKKELETHREHNENEITRREHRKDLWYKGLAATAGVVVGLGLSSVPGVGTIRMVASGTKLAISGINVWTKKHPEGKIAKLINETKESIKDNYPNIANKIASIKNKLRNVLSNEKINCFVNGVAAGYMAGNILEMVTGQTIGEHLGNLFSNGENAELATGVISDSVTNKVPNNTPNKVPTNSKPVNISDNIPNSVPDSVPNTIVENVMESVSNITLEPGNVYDISGLTEGLISSDSNDLIGLITSAGKEAVVDQFMTLPNGEVMVHFKQINGAGYAWFKESVVKEYLAKVSEVAVKSGRSM